MAVKLEDAIPVVKYNGVVSNQTVDFSGSGSVSIASATGKVGFFGATPVVQPASPTGNTHTPTAGATTSVYVNTTFDGSIGSSAYTVGDIVIALKNLGILAQ